MHGAGRLPAPGRGAGIDLPVGAGRAHPWDEQGLGAVAGESLCRATWLGVGKVSASRQKVHGVIHVSMVSGLPFSCMLYGKHWW